MSHARFTLFVLLAATLTLLSCKSIVQKDTTTNVLVFSKTKGFRHGSISAGKRAIVKLGKKHNFAAEISEDAAVFTKENLKKYKVVIFLNTTGDILNEEQQAAFTQYIQSGGGFVGIHAATDTEYDWPWYNQLIGAYFDGHPSDPNVREAEVQRIDKRHISTHHLPEIWKRTDEWYNYRSINPDIHVLLNLDESTYGGGTNGESHPIAWCHEFDGGRSFHTGFGHTNETFKDPLFLEHLWGGIQYAAVAPAGN